MKINKEIEIDREVRNLEKKDCLLDANMPQIWHKRC